MKILLHMFIFLIWSTATFGAIISKELKCSRAGTDVVLVNGISWGRDTVKYITKTLIEPSIPKSYIDNKFPSGSFVEFKFSYNHSNGFLRDMLESAVQKYRKTLTFLPIMLLWPLIILPIKELLLLISLKAFIMREELRLQGFRTI